MDNYLKNNKELWNELTPIHERSAFYDVAGFKAGRCSLKSIELEEMGDVSGKSLLHLLFLIYYFTFFHLTDSRYYPNQEPYNYSNIGSNIQALTTTLIDEDSNCASEYHAGYTAYQGKNNGI